jgi:hypothetical protein
MILLCALSTFSFMAPAADKKLHEIQIYIGLFLFLLLGIALSNFVLAKIPVTRQIIDQLLGANFISDHRINMKAAQLAKVAAGVASGVVMTSIDTHINDVNNINTVGRLAETLNNTGQSITTQQTDQIMSRPSALQQVVNKGVNVVEKLVNTAVKGNDEAGK